MLNKLKSELEFEVLLITLGKGNPDKVRELADKVNALESLNIMDRAKLGLIA